MQNNYYIYLFINYSYYRIEIFNIKKILFAKKTSIYFGFGYTIGIILPDQPL